MSNSPPKNDINDENDLFYFESDHLALRGNRDYSELLKTMFILQAQRKQAIENYNKVVTLQKECLNEPLAFVEKLKNDTFREEVPTLMNIPEIPKINWAKYNVKIADCYLKEISSDTPVDHEITYDDTKINSKSWTTEEQRKLEELLLKYPPEPLESKRIKKIASEFGTRTAKQICSRLQKYFLKLQKAGIHIPGQPRRTMTEYRVHKRNKQKYQKQYNMMRPTTFFPELDIPVIMNESEEVPGPSNQSQISEPASSNSSNYLLANNYHNKDKVELPKSNIDVQLLLLRKIKLEKESNDHPFRHVGYRCDYCDEDPILGSRWHCSSCVEDSIDFCTDCMLTQLYSDNPHSMKHRFLIIKDDKTASYCIDSESEPETGSCDDTSVKNDESNYDSSEPYSEEDNENSDQELPNLNQIENHVSYNNVSIKEENEEDVEENELPELENETEAAEESNEVHDENHFEVNNVIIKQEMETTDYEIIHFGDEKVSEDCPNNIFEEPNNLHFLNKFNHRNNFTDTQNVGYNYLHSNLLIDDS